MFKCSKRDCYLKSPFSRSFHVVKNVIKKALLILLRLQAFGVCRALGWGDCACLWLWGVGVAVLARPEISLNTALIINLSGAF